MKEAFAKGFYKQSKVLDSSLVTDYIHRPDPSIKNPEFSPEKFEPTAGVSMRERATQETIQSSELIKSAKKKDKNGKFFEVFFGKLEESDKPKRAFWPDTMSPPDNLSELRQCIARVGIPIAIFI